MIPGSANPLLLATAAGAGDYEIERSVRFNSSDSAYCSKTYSSSPTDRTRQTVSFWIKLGNLSSTQRLFAGYDGSSNEGGAISYVGNSLYFSFGGAGTRAVLTTSVFRDPSAWYHVLFKVDSNTTDAVTGHRVAIFVNGVQQSTASDSISQGALSQLLLANSNNRIGCTHVQSDFFSGYLADIHFIDGQALDPTSFGEFDTNGIWQPKAYTGTYGTNGFHLPFSDNSTAAALGTDTSGNSNTWTVNNISVTAGAGNDSLVDSPTNGTQTDTGVGGEVVGNYCTWNPLANFLTLANGNLDASQVSSAHHLTYGTIGVGSGKWYFEITKNDNLSTSSTSIGFGITEAKNIGLDGYILEDAGWHSVYLQGGTNYYDDSLYPATSPNSATCHNSGTWMIAIDIDAGKGWVGKDGVWFSPGSVTGGNPVSDIGAVFTQIVPGRIYVPFLHEYAATSTSANFGQRPFAYAAPSGFKSLNTANLPTPTITTSGSYTGNGVADGPFVYLNGVPTAMTVGGNAVTFGTHADKLSNGFKIRTTSTTYNQNASTYNYTITTTGAPFKTARAQANP